MNMKHSTKYLLPLVLGCATSLTALAEEQGKEKSWTAEAELGFLRTSGNSDTETLNARFHGTKSYSLFKHTLDLEALNSSQNDERSAEKYLAKLQSDYDIGERSYLLGAVDWEKDLFSSFDYKASIVFGYGYKAIKRDDMTLDLELAPGYRISEPDPGETEKEGIVRAGEKFTMVLSENSNLDQYLTVDYGDSNTVTKFGVGVTSQIAGSLSMRLGYALTHNSDVTGDASNTDTETSVTLVYSFH